MPDASLHLSGDPEADAFLSKDPLALLIGMVLDQQVPLEKAFSSPAELERRLGGHGLDARSIADADPDDLAAVFSERPALHRFPGSMAGRVQEMCRVIADEYGGDAAAVWTGAEDGAELLARIRKLPGFGEHKAKIFVALLGKQLGVQPAGWREASAPFGEPESLRSIADIVDAGTMARVREAKQQAKAAHKAEQARAAGAQGRSPVKKTRGARKTDPGAAAR